MSDNKQIFAEFLDDQQMREAYPGGSICRRTLDQRVAEGLPYVKLGGRRLFRIESVREWLLSHETDRSPRRPGRPRRSPTKRGEQQP